MHEVIDAKRIQSFVRRQGRITIGQQHALQHYRHKYCLEFADANDVTHIFGRKAPLIVEIGFGNGESLAITAEANPHLNYLGIEIHLAGIGHLMLLLEQRGLKNVRIIQHDAVDVIQEKCEDESLAGIQLFFPDPWQKRKHHKRRLVCPSFINLIIRKLQPGGYFHTATDWEEYAKEMLSLLNNKSELKNLSPNGAFYPRPNCRPITKFEKRGLKLGHSVLDMMFEKLG